MGPLETEILFAWAHLSDLSAGRGDACDAHDRALVLAELQHDLARAPQRGCPKLDALLVTGDIAWSGAPAEYEIARAALRGIARAAQVEDNRVFVVPGNHDVDRSADADKNTARLIKGLRRGEEQLDVALESDGDTALLRKRLDPYLAFAAGFAPGCGNLFWVQRLDERGLRVRLVGLNTALVSGDGGDKGNLRLGMTQLGSALLGAASDDLIMVLSHHPFRGGWLADEKNADAWIRNHAHLHLFGHVKDADSEAAFTGAGGHFVRIAAGAAHTEGGEHGYSIAAIVRAVDGSLAVRLWPRRWSDRNKGFRDDAGNVPEGQRFTDHALRLRLAPPTIRPPIAVKVASFEGPGGVPIRKVPHFLGRDAEMRELRAALADDRAVCVVATGLGGIGKTSLVRQLVAEIAEEQAPMFPDGAVWIDAMSLDVDAARACDRFGYRGERRPTVAEAAKFLASALHDKRVLVVIDNVWPDRVDVSALPIAGGKSRTVLTSRATDLHESIGHEAQLLVLGRWNEETCRAYLREVVKGLAASADRDLDALTAFVGYLPLAVRLLARLLMRPGTTPARLLDRLENEPIGTLDKVATGADRGVAATFEASYEELDDTHRRVLLALAACARVTTGDVVGQVAGKGDPDDEVPKSTATPWIESIAGVSDAADALADLAERSLVECVDREAGLWTLHDVVRLFVRAQPGIGEADFTHVLLAERHVAAHQDPLDWQAMEAGMGEVLAAVDRLVAAGAAMRAAGLTAWVRNHLMQRGRYGELIARYEQLMHHLPDGSTELAVVLGNAGTCFNTLGDIPKAIEHHQRALAIYEQLGDQGEQAAALGNLGLATQRKRTFQRRSSTSSAR